MTKILPGVSLAVLVLLDKTWLLLNLNLLLDFKLVVELANPTTYGWGPTPGAQVVLHSFPSITGLEPAGK